MKRILTAHFIRPFAICLAFALALCLPCESTASGFRLSKRRVTLRAGAYERVLVRSKPTLGLDALYAQSSNEEYVIAYAENSAIHITAVKQGSALVTVWSGLNSAVIDVKVLPPLATSAYMAQEDVTLRVGERVNLKANALPDGAAASFKWKSDNPQVASVNAKGFVRAKKPGQALITATTANAVKCGCIITVLKKSAQKDGVIRILSVANQDYADPTSDLMGSVPSMDALTYALKSNPAAGMAVARHSAYINQTGDQIRALLNGLIDWGISDQDTTVFIFSGHGTYRGAYGNSYLCGTDLGEDVSVANVQQALDRIPGKVYVILDCCFSGGFIGKSAIRDSRAFNNGVVKVFARQSAKTLTGQKYHVITASAGNQVGYGVFGTLTDGTSFALSLLNYSLAYGGGFDQLEQRSLMPMPADKDGDGGVSFAEAYDLSWAQCRQIITSINEQKNRKPGDPDYAVPPDVQVFPENDATVIFQSRRY